MITWHPSPSFAESAACLDARRLERQHLHMQRTLATLRGPHGLPVAWRTDPCVLQWEGYESALGVYMTITCEELTIRGLDGGYVTPYSRETFLRSPGYPGEFAEDGREAPTPPWLGSTDYHEHHRRYLLGAYPEWYRQFGWRVVPSMDLWWPTAEMEI
jgi:hypothetical protein